MCLLARFIIPVVAAIFMCISSAYSQVEQAERLEIPYDEYRFDMNIMPLGDNGVIAYKENLDFDSNGNTQWDFTKYDTLFNVAWKNKYSIGSQYKYVGYHNEGVYFYILFTKGENQNSEFKIIRLNNYNGELLTYDDKFLIALQLTEFKVLENKAFFCGTVKDYPAIVLYNFDTKRGKVVPGIYQKNTSFVSLDFEPQNEIFNVTLSHKLYGSRYTISIKSYSLEGELLNNVSLKPTKGENLITGKMTTLPGGERFITGTYTTYRSTDYSKGMFIAKLVDDKQEFIEFYPYADLKNFFSYMKPRRQERIKEKIKRRKMEGKEIKLTYKLYMHDIIPLNDRFIVVGEAYYPQYNQQNYYYAGNSTRFFEGYKYTHAVVLAFDKKGNMLWDNSFEIKDALTKYLVELVKVKPSDKEVYLLYNYDNEIFTKVVNGYEVVGEKSKEKIKTNFTNDIVSRDSEIGSTEFWYNNYFLTWGTQDIRNYKDKNVDSNRKVFYLNKVKVKNGE
jgi:hypothetical protein